MKEGGKRPGHREQSGAFRVVDLSPLEIIQLLRSQSAQVGLYRGSRDEELHDFSENRVRVEFPDRNRPGRTIRAERKLHELASAAGLTSSATFVELFVGTPDTFITEPGQYYFFRTCFELRRIGKALTETDITQDGEKERQLFLLQQTLLESRIFPLWRSGATNAKIEFSEDPNRPPNRFMSIFVPARKTYSFHFPLYRYPPETQRRFEEIGTRRKIA